MCVKGDWEVSCSCTAPRGLSYGRIEGGGGKVLDELGYVWVEFSG